MIRNVKGRPIRKILSPIQRDTLSPSVDSIVKLAGDLDFLKKSVVATVDNKIEEVEVVVEEKILEIDQKVEETVQIVQQLAEETRNIAVQGEPGIDADEERVIKEVVSQIRKDIPDRESIIKEALLRVPKPLDEKKLIEKMMKSLPDNKASLKVIQEKIEIDPMSVIEKIMALPEGKFKIKPSMVDGLDQTISAFRNQLSRGYLHGGGDTVEAGTNITITTTANGKKRISSTAGGSGTVTDVSVVTANGVSGSVANSTTTPAITLTLGAITPSSVNVSGLTASQITATDGSKNLQSLDTATYPSLTELSYVKGVTSAIQTQLNTKGTGTVTAVSVASANGFAGSSSGGATPQLTLSTTVTGVLVGNGTAIAATTTTGSGSVVLDHSPTLVTPLLGTPTSGVLTNCTGLPAASVVAGTFGTGAYVMDTKLTVPQVINTPNAITAVGNAATVPITHRISNVTNNSAATLTITMATASATDGMMIMVRIFDFSGVAQTLSFVNTENSTVSVPSTSNGSTTLPLTVGFQYNSATSKWRCIASA